MRVQTQSLAQLWYETGRCGCAGVGSVNCTQDGSWSHALPTCELNDPCTAEEDDCSPVASCAHTGPGEHTCECFNDGDGSEDFYADGSLCLPCSDCSLGEIVETACTSVADTVCTAVVCDALTAPEHGVIEYSDGKLVHHTRAI